MGWTFPLCPKPPNWSLDWGELLASFDWLGGLADTPQDPSFHPEGDVLIHTRMVVEALVDAPRWRALDDESRSILFAAALLHDAGKPVTTQVIDGRLSSPGHARKGAQIAQAILYQQWPDSRDPVPFHARQRIVGLVRHHGLPVWYWEREDADRQIIAASLRMSLDRLSLLAEMDLRGRTAEDVGDLLARVDLFREESQSLGCFADAYPFPSDHTRFLYFRSDTRSPTIEAFDDTRCEVVLMSGLPGAGKDTWIVANLPDWPILSLDELRKQLEVSPADGQGAVVMQAKERAREYLRRTESFVWNATNVTRQTRASLIDLFAAYHARVRIVYVEAPWTDLLRRNRQRTSPIPEQALYSMAKRLEVPELTEAQMVEWQAQ